MDPNLMRDLGNERYQSFVSATPLQFAVLYYPVLRPREVITGLTPLAGRVSVLLVRAGEEAPDLNREIDEFVEQYLAAGGEVTLLRYDAGFHGFDTLDHNDEARAVIVKSIEYIEERLANGP